MTSLSFVDVAENKRMTKESHDHHIRNDYLSVTCFLFFLKEKMLLLKTGRRFLHPRPDGL
jgi:hypothetical protein